MATANELMDYGKLGVMLKRARKNAGFSSAAKYADAINNAMGIRITPVVIYKIESGKQEPKAYQILAFSFVLFGDIYAPEMTAILHKCMCEEWQRIDREHALKTLESVSKETMQAVREVAHARAVLQ